MKLRRAPFFLAFVLALFLAWSFGAVSVAERKKARP